MGCIVLNLLMSRRHWRCPGKEGIKEYTNKGNIKNHSAHLSSSTHTDVHTHTHMYTHTCIHTQTYTHTHIHKTYTHTHINVYTHTHTHKRTHTHMYTYTLLHISSFTLLYSVHRSWNNHESYLQVICIPAWNHANSIESLNLGYFPTSCYCMWTCDIVHTVANALNYGSCKVKDWCFLFVLFFSASKSTFVPRAPGPSSKLAITGYDTDGTFLQILPQLGLTLMAPSSKLP